MPGNILSDGFFISAFLSIASSIVAECDWKPVKWQFRVPMAPSKQ
tara:strand:- start:30938 stop:31072 length:135 start_codon:yes stop_codon:yes gene_type:complete